MYIFPKMSEWQQLVKRVSHENPGIGLRNVLMKAKTLYRKGGASRKQQQQQQQQQQKQQRQRGGNGEKYNCTKAENGENGEYVEQEDGSLKKTEQDTTPVDTTPVVTTPGDTIGEQVATGGRRSRRRKSARKPKRGGRRSRRNQKDRR